MSIELKAGETKRLDVKLTPLVQTGIIQGYVVDAETGEHIPSAAIYLDGEFALYSWTDDVGGYRIADIPYGTHTVTVEANNYQTTDFEVKVDQPIQSINLEMPPLPPGPPGWSDGVEVQSVAADPPIVYLGQTVQIKVYIQYGIHNPDAYPVPATICGTVRVNGQELTGEFNIDYRNPTLAFPFTPSSIGIFMAVAQDKSTTFEVKPEVPGLYYSPYGEADPYSSKGDMITSWVNYRNWRPYAPSPQNIFPPVYKGPIKDFTFWGDMYSDKMSTRCPICGESLGDTTHEGIFTDLFNHIEQRHPDYPWDKPKGGIVFARMNYVSYDRWDLEGIVLKPGHHAGEHTIQWLGLPEVVKYDVTLPGWGDRVYINIDTGETVLVTWEEIISSP